MKITVVGSGYVGLVVGICLSDYGNDVICVDVDKEKIAGLKKGSLPIYEPGLKDLLDRNLEEKRIEFTTDIAHGIKESDAIFIAVGTPMGEGYRADLRYVFQVAKSIGENINGYKAIIDKSTVPVTTGDRVSMIIREEMKKRGVKHEFDVVSNPEFLREGTAIKDFTNPDRIVIGTDSERAKEVINAIYGGIARADKPIMYTDVKSAEIIKYASNAMLATRISFMNMISHLCEKVGGNIKEVAKGMGLDNRIGPRFLQAGAGYGGSCFPKDVQALIATLEENGCPAEILLAVEEINQLQKRSIAAKMKQLLPDLKGKTIALWGLAFKPKTDDMREAPSLVIIEDLMKEGAKIRAFDPEAQEVARKLVLGIEFCPTPYGAAEGSDGLILVTEWNEFRNLDMKRVKESMKKPNLVDARNVYEPEKMAEIGFRYVSIGRKINAQK